MDGQDIGKIVALSMFALTILFGIYYFGRIWLETNGMWDRLRHLFSRKKK